MTETRKTFRVSLEISRSITLLMKRALYIAGALGLLALIWLGIFNNKAKSERIKEELKVEIGAVPVKVIKPQVTTLQRPLAVVGTVRPKATVLVASETAGRVVVIGAERGQYLAKGAPLAKVDDELAQAALQASEARLEQTKRDLERYQNLREQNAGTDIQLENARLQLKIAEAEAITARRQLADKTIRMPVAGIIATRHTELGNLLNPGSPVAEILDVGYLKVDLLVSEQAIADMQAGQKVSVTSSVVPGKTWQGSVMRIGPSADAAHNFPVEVLVSSGTAVGLKPGMFARVEFTGRASSARVTVPREALVGSTKQPQVYVVKDGVARLRNITLAQEVGNMLALDGGLSADETVVVSGQINLQDSTQVRVLE